MDLVIEILNQNTKLAQQAVSNLILARPWKRECACGQALANALITDPAKIPAETRETLQLLVGNISPIKATVCCPRHHLLPMFALNAVYYYLTALFLVIYCTALA